MKLKLNITGELSLEQLALVARALSQSDNDVLDVATESTGNDVAPATQQAETEKPKKTKKAAVVATQSQHTEQPQAETPVEPEKPKAEPVKKDTTPTAEDVREAMHQVRERIEGADYKNNTESEGYKTYHKVLTKEFKRISALYGSDKPSALAPDMRKAFIEDCKNIKVDNGAVAETPLDEVPF